jgi:hypothetical protein
VPVVCNPGLYTREYNPQNHIQHSLYTVLYTVPEFIDPVFAKTSRKRSFSVTENERFELVFAKTESVKSGTDVFKGTVALEKYKFRDSLAFRDRRLTSF